MENRTQKHRLYEIHKRHRSNLTYKLRSFKETIYFTILNLEVT